MAIETYKLSNGAIRYKAVAYLDNHQKKSKRGFTTKKAAKRWIAEMQILGVPKKKEHLTYGDVVDQWLEQYKPTVKPSTYVTACSEIQSSYPIIPRDKLISAVTPDDVADLAYYFSYHYCTIKIRIARIKSIFTYAVDEEIIDQNPFRKFKMPKQQKKGTEYQMWTKENLKDFLEACQKENSLIVYPLFRLLAYSGIRVGELTALKWSDLQGNQLSIKRTMTVDYDSGYVMGSDTKTPSSQRTIALDQETISILEDWKTISPSKDRMFPVLPSRVPEWMHRIIAKNPHIPNSTPHKLRHLHCTILLDANASIKDVQERLGHATAKTTLDVYAHANPDKTIVADIFTNAMEETRH